MHPRLLRTFLAVARHHSVTRAAEEVHLAQSSVSDQIQSLESELGTSLFTRAKSGFELTLAGETLRSYAEGILALADEARAAVQSTVGRAAGPLAIGALETIAAATLPRWLSGFRDEHPDTALRLKVAGSGELLRMLEDGGIDIAFCFDRGSLDERFARRILSVEPLVLVAPPGHFPGETPADLPALASEGFVATEAGCVYRQMLDMAFAEAGIAAPKPAAEVGSIHAIARLVAAGTGVALVPRLAVGDALDRGEIVELPWPGSARSAALAAIWRRRRVQPPVLTLLLAALDNGFAPVKPAGGRPRHAVLSLS